MTLSSTHTTVSYAGDGITTAFPVTFQFFDSADLEVVERVIATGAETVKTLGTDYTVSGGNGSTGTVTATSAPASTVEWHIRRKTARTQSTDYVENDPFPAETHEKALDRAMMVAQEVDTDANLALRFPKTDPATSIGELPNSTVRANQFLLFDANGKPGVASSVTDAPVSAFMKTVLDDPDAPTARQTLGVDAGTGLTQSGTDLNVDVGTTANKIVQLDASAKLPAVDGSQLLNLPGGGLKSVTVFTASGTWTKPAGVKKIVVWVVAAGGGGGGGISGGGGGGGGAGGAAIKLMDVSAISSVSVTVGAGGAGGASGADGAAGGSSSFGVYCSATGGFGGNKAIGGGNYGSLGGVGSGGDVNLGGGGGIGEGASSNQGMPGGSGFLGGGGRTVVNAVGNTGGNYGGGGGGGGGANAGGNGGAGVVIVWEYE